jgi:hypothetical protein
VKTLLFNEDTSEYLKSLREWTLDIHEAFDFECATVAAEFCRDFRWREMNILLVNEKSALLSLKDR